METISYDISELRNILKDILISQGYNEEDAGISSEVLLYAEIRGNNQGNKVKSIYFLWNCRID